MPLHKHGPWKGHGVNEMNFSAEEKKPPREKLQFPSVNGIAMYNHAASVLAIVVIKGI